MTRQKLIDAYIKSTGRSPFGRSKEREANAAEIPGVISVAVNPREIERYEAHKIANVRIPADNFAQIAFIVDTESLAKIAPVTAIWLTQAPDTLTVHVSAGVQKTRKNAQAIDLEKDLQGLLITNVALSRDKSPSFYQSRVTQLYS